MRWPWVSRARLEHAVRLAGEARSRMTEAEFERDRLRVDLLFSQAKSTELEKDEAVLHAEIKAEMLKNAGLMRQLREATERADSLLDKMLAMKQQGFTALPPKIAPQAGTSEDGYMKRELAAQKGPDPFIEGLLAEGKTLEEAHAIRKQAQQDFKAGEM